MTRVLVTGASGLIGRATVAALGRAGYEVWTLGRDTGPAPAGVSHLLADLTHLDATRHAVETAQADALVHLAWLTGPDRWHGAANLDWVSHSFNLVKAFAASGGRRVVGVGSCAEYDWSFETLSETTPLRPATAYGAAKAATGLALLGTAPALGLSLAWARVFFVFGPGEPRGRLFGDVIHGLRAGETVDCTDGLQRRDFLHVDELGEALAELAISDVTGAINIAHGSALPVRDLILELARQLGGTDRIALGARVRPASDPDQLSADVTRARALLRFRPQLSWSEAVARVLDETPA